MNVNMLEKSKHMTIHHHGKSRFYAALSREQYKHLSSAPQNTLNVDSKHNMQLWGTSKQFTKELLMLLIKY